MPGSKSNYLENAILNHVLGGMSYTPPASMDIALYTLAPDDAGGGTEVTGGSYLRVNVANNATTWPAASAGSKSNGIEIEFPKATADWGTIVAFALFDTAATPNMLYWGDLTTSKIIASSDTAIFEIGSIVIQED